MVGESSGPEEKNAAEEAQFDFETHRRTAIDSYMPVFKIHEEFAYAIRHFLADSIERKGLKINIIEARAKKPESLGKKAMTPSESDPNRPKYRSPLEDITDLSGVRVITFFPRTVEQIGHCIHEEFEVIEFTDHGAARLQEERLGYQSVHYIVRLTTKRYHLPEYQRYRGMKAEIQVRTVMQHAWAEIEHDIQYKSSTTIPLVIKQRFSALAGLLEIADREFQAIQDADSELRQEARERVREGSLRQVEITRDSLQAYLDRRLGSDARVSDFSYEYLARKLRKLGFTNFEQVDDCISGYDDDAISRKVWGTRQGQLTRFETVLLASMGENYLRLYPDRQLDEFSLRDIYAKRLEALRRDGIEVGSYSPSADDDNAQIDD